MLLWSVERSHACTRFGLGTLQSMLEAVVVDFSANQNWAVRCTAPPLRSLFSSCVSSWVYCLGQAAAFGFFSVLDFWPFKLQLLRLPLPGLLDLADCRRMLESSDQLTQVGIQVGSCAVTISGPLAEVVPLLNHLQAFGPEAAEPPRRSYTGAVTGPASSPSPVPASSLRVSPVVPRSPLRVPSAASDPSRPLSPPTRSAPVPVTQDHLQGCPAQVSGPTTRADLAASLPPCPSEWLDRAGTLTAAANLDGRGRILRAWIAGAWARLVLQGVVGTPAASRQLNLPSRYYAVIGGEGVRPALYRSFREYSRALGPIEACPAVSHAFPTELETQVYCAGAQVEWPLIPGTSV